jgi:hypothetical protein
MTKFLLIDAENIFPCSADLDSLFQKEDIYVYFFYGTTQVKKVEPLKQHANFFAFEKPGVGVKNSLDHIIACWTGRLVERYGDQHEFFILSNDHGFNGMIALLKGEGKKIVRITKITQLGMIKTDIDKQVHGIVDGIYSESITGNIKNELTYKSRPPKTVLKLSHYLGSKTYVDNIEHAIHALVAYGFIEVLEDRTNVVYDFDKITATCQTGKMPEYNESALYHRDISHVIYDIQRMHISENAMLALHRLIEMNNRHPLCPSTVEGLCMFLSRDVFIKALTETQSESIVMLLASHGYLNITEDRNIHYNL